MTVRLSSALRDALMGEYGLAFMMAGGHIQVYSGDPPASADMPPPGVLLARITTGGKPVGTTGSGLVLTMGAIPGEAVNKDEWVLTGLASGAPGWWRFVWADADAGAQSMALPRIDGAASDGVQGLPASISATTVVAVRRFSISLDE